MTQKRQQLRFQILRQQIDSFNTQLAEKISAAIIENENKPDKQPVFSVVMNTLNKNG